MMREKLSRPASSVPKRWLAVGGCSRFITSRSSGLCGATSGPKAATSAHAPTMAAPVQSAVLLRALNRWPGRTGPRAREITRDGASPATVSDPDPGVEHAVEQVHDEVHHNVDDPGEQRHAEDGRIVEPGRRRDGIAADPGPGEQRFRQDRA